MFNEVRKAIINHNYRLADKLLDKIYEAWLSTEDDEVDFNGDETKLLFFYLDFISKKLYG
jgi:hypothetical protein